MSRPFHFPTSDDLMASELYAVVSGVPGQGARPAGPPGVPQVPAPVGPPDVPQVPAPVHPEGAQLSAPLSESSLRILDEEEWRSLTARRGSSRPARAEPPPQPPLVLRPRQRPPSQRPPSLPPGQPPPVQYFAVLPQTSLERRSDGAYPFRRECLRRIFRSLSEAPDSPLPVRAGPGQPGLDHHPYFCPYHQLMGHALEDCFQFKEWLKEAVTEGTVVLPAAYLQDRVSSPESCASNSVAASGGWPSSDDI